MLPLTEFVCPKNRSPETVAWPQQQRLVGDFSLTLTKCPFRNLSVLEPAVWPQSHGTVAWVAEHVDAPIVGTVS